MEDFGLYNDCKVRPISFGDESSPNSVAHDIWHQQFTAEERLNVLYKVDPDLTLVERYNACVNYIADNISMFTRG